jgi:hypothetical protein
MEAKLLISLSRCTIVRFHIRLLRLRRFEGDHDAAPLITAIAISAWSWWRLLQEQLTARGLARSGLGELGEQRGGQWVPARDSVRRPSTSAGLSLRWPTIRRRGWADGLGPPRGGDAQGSCQRVH